jgi:hypothetical protein
VSYAWDRLIEYFARHALAGTFEFGNELTENELIFRAMARESRLMRRFLAEVFLGFHELAEQRRVRSRICESDSGIVYVFLNSRPQTPREARNAELYQRCIVARSMNKGCKGVIGLGINIDPAPQGHAEDVVYLHHPEWTEELESQAREIQEKFGYFVAPEVRHRHDDEYPNG